MAHEIDVSTGKAACFVGRNQPAWHGLGAVIEGLADSTQGLALSGQGWRVEQNKLFTRVQRAMPPEARDGRGEALSERAGHRRNRGGRQRGEGAMMTANELLTIARENRPNVRYTSNRNGTAVAAWSNLLGRWQVVAAKGLDREWYSLPSELLVNGIPMKAEDWLPEEMAAPA